MELKSPGQYLRGPVCPGVCVKTCQRQPCSETRSSTQEKHARGEKKASGPSGGKSPEEVGKAKRRGCSARSLFFKDGRSDREVNANRKKKTHCTTQATHYARWGVSVIHLFSRTLISRIWFSIFFLSFISFVPSFFHLWIRSFFYSFIPSSNHHIHNISYIHHTHPHLHVSLTTQHYTSRKQHTRTLQDT